MLWKRMLAYLTGSVNEDLLCRIECLLEENRVLRNQIQQRLLLTDHERNTLAEKAIALGKLMADTVTIVKFGKKLESRDSGPNVQNFLNALSCLPTLILSLSF